MPKQVISVIGCLNINLTMVMDRLAERGECRRAETFTEGIGGKGAVSAIAAYRSCHCKPLTQEEASRAGDAADDTAFDPIASTTEKGKHRLQTVQRQPSKGKLSSGLSLFPSTSWTLHAADTALHRTAKESLASSIPALAPGFKNDIEVRLVGAVGEDDAEKFETALKANFINTDAVKSMSEMRSNICFVVVEKSGENRCIFKPEATNAWTEHDFKHPEQLAPNLKSRLPDLIMLQMEMPKTVVRAAIRTAGAAGIEVLLNSAPAELLDRGDYKYVTHLLMNETEAAVLSGRETRHLTEAVWPKVTRQFLDLGVKNVVITLGGKGAYYATSDGEKNLVPGYNVDVVDTTGAGDTFNGVYATDYLRQRAAKEWKIETAVERAVKASALTTTELGTFDVIPWSDDIDAFDYPQKLTLTRRARVAHSTESEEDNSDRGSIRGSLLGKTPVW